MSSKAKVIIAIVLTLVLVSGIWITVLHFRTKSITEKYTGEISQLTATLDALGPNVDCYTLTEEYYEHYNRDTTGQVIQDNGLQVISVPSSLVGDSYVTNPNEIIGKYWKVNVQPGTPITRDLVMAEKYDDTLRDVDIVVNSWVVGMREGDYVDINLTLPWGQDYIVLPRKRIMEINDKTVKMYMTESEWHTYQSALVDWYLYQDKGARMYFKKYVEPGVQPTATAYYALRSEVQSVIYQDPNIVNRAFEQMTATTRSAIDAEFNRLTTDQDTLMNQVSKISAGSDQYTSDVQSDVNTDIRERANNESNSEDTYEVQDVNISLEVSDTQDVSTYEQMVEEPVADDYVPVVEEVTTDDPYAETEDGMEVVG